MEINNEFFAFWSIIGWAAGFGLMKLLWMDGRTSSSSLESDSWLLDWLLLVLSVNMLGRSELALFLLGLTMTVLLDVLIEELPPKSDSLVLRFLLWDAKLGRLVVSSSELVSANSTMTLELPSSRPNEIGLTTEISDTTEWGHLRVVYNYTQCCHVSHALGQLNFRAYFGRGKGDEFAPLIIRFLKKLTYMQTKQH